MKTTPDILAQVEYFNADKFTNKEYLSTEISIMPDHLIKDGYLTCGKHYYFEEEKIYPKRKYKAEIKFMTPELYPGSLWIGRKIKLQRGGFVLGEATVVEIYNKTLEKT